MTTPPFHARRLCAAAATIALCAAAAAAAAPGAACAAASSQTTAISVANTQAGLVFASDGHTGGPGVSNVASANASAGSISDSQVDAEFHVGSGPSQFPASWAVGYSAELFSGQQGHSDLNTLATVSTLDRLTLTGLPSDDRAVTLHSAFELREGVGGFPGFTNFADDISDENFSASAHALLRIIGDGIGPSELGNDVFAFRDITADPHHEGFGTFEGPTFIDFNLHMTLGQAQNFGLTMIDTGVISIDDFRGNLDGRMLSQDGASLTWLGGISVTDDRTGQLLCGLTLTAESGINFGPVAACPGGGGDGGGGGGTDGVPEPTTWTLMITGFGLAGAALRRRTRAAFQHA